MPATLESRLTEWFIQSIANKKSCDLNLSDLDDDQEFLSLKHIAAAVGNIEKEISGFSFALDKQLATYISGYKSLAYVTSHVLSQNVLFKILGGCYSRLDMMVAQSFMISAIEKQHYTLRNITGQSISTSVTAIPCLLNHDHRILIPFFVKELEHEIYLVCNEFWGHPCGVIDFVDRVYYTDRTSTKMVLDDPSISIRSLILNLLAWHLAKVSESIELDAPKANTLLGGSINLTHILWNYLGGIEVLRRSNLLNYDYNLVQTSSLLFPVDHLPVSPIDISSFNPLDQVFALAKLGLISGLWIRCSDAGINPTLAKNLLVAHHINKNIHPKEHETEQIKCESFIDTTNALNRFMAIQEPIRANNDPNEVSIAMQIRCHNRFLINQELVYTQIIQILSDSLPCLHIILDGSSKGADFSVIQKEQEVACSIQANDKIKSLVQAKRLRISTTIGINLVDQLQLFTHINTYLGYASGGLVKLIAFCRFLGTAMSPATDYFTRTSHCLQDIDPGFL